MGCLQVSGWGRSTCRHVRLSPAAKESETQAVAASYNHVHRIYVVNKDVRPAGHICSAIWAVPIKGRFVGEARSAPPAQEMQ